MSCLDFIVLTAANSDELFRLNALACCDARYGFQATNRAMLAGIYNIW